MRIITKLKINVNIKIKGRIKIKGGIRTKGSKKIKIKGRIKTKINIKIKIETEVNLREIHQREGMFQGRANAKKRNVCDQDRCLRSLRQRLRMPIKG